MFIKEAWNITKDVRVIELESGLNFRPGQFIMMWLPGVGEKPFSLAWNNLLVIKKVGRFTSEVFKLEEGDPVWIRGPYGSGFFIRGETAMMVAGGVGIPPIYALLRMNAGRLKRVVLVYGARSEGDVVLLDAPSYADELRIATDDGSLGRKGVVTDLMDDVKEFDQVYACGPEGMIRAVLKKTGYRNVQVSMERYMRCGIGVCGSCALGKYLVCRDGPVFRGEDLRGLI
ncbi:MAG: dihydroorotate dehydrogenase electron transfer subunit [Thermococci archaeon]|nr:dihydroorotate dehydrogenase electron transfer subunit [Thermococci archaeon]